MTDILSPQETVLSQLEGGVVRKIKIELVAESMVEEMSQSTLIEYAMEMFRSDLEETDYRDVELLFQEIFSGEIEDYSTQIEMLMEYEAEFLSPEKLRDNAIARVIFEISKDSDSMLDFQISKIDTGDYAL